MHGWIDRWMYGQVDGWVKEWKEECDGGQDVVSIRVSSKESHLSFCVHKRQKHSPLCLTTDTVKTPRPHMTKFIPHPHTT